jgi:predicted O-methyltransferase YrrM
MRPLPQDLKTNNALIDAYLDNGFAQVRGMSSRFATSISSWLMLMQSEAKIEGDFLEIGTFEGRYFIALAHALKPTEIAIGIDTFDWPNERVEATLHENATNNALQAEKFITLKTNTANLTPQDISRHFKNKTARFIHIDGDHSPDPLTKDLELAINLLHPKGLICLDDMLHPAYPFLVVTVNKFLEKHADYRLMCIIDREDIIGAAKFLLCHKDVTDFYEQALMTHYKKRHFVLGGDARGHHCVVLTPRPRLARVD